MCLAPFSFNLLYRRFYFILFIIYYIQGYIHSLCHFLLVGVNFTVVEHLKNACFNVSMIGRDAYVYACLLTGLLAGLPVLWLPLQPADLFHFDVRSPRRISKATTKKGTSVIIYTYMYLYMCRYVRIHSNSTYNALWIRCAACKSWQAENIRYTVDRAGKILSNRWIYLCIRMIENWNEERKKCEIVSVSLTCSLPHSVSPFFFLSQV